MPTPRSGHVDAPKLPRGTIAIQPPPDVVESQGPANIIMMIVPMFGSMGIMIFMAMSNTSNPRMLLLAGFMVVAMISMVGFTTYRQISQHRQKVNTQRREYLAYLAGLREDVRRGEQDQRAVANWQLPMAEALPMLVQQGERLWERDGGNPLSFSTKIGVSDQPLVLDLQEPELAPLADSDPVCLSAVTRFVSTYRMVDDLPVGISIGDYANIEITGNRVAGRELARGMVMTLATLVNPDEFKVAIVRTDDIADEWDWVKWLPHARSAERDAIGPMRMIGGTVAEVTGLLPAGMLGRPAFRARSAGAALPQLLLIVDGVPLSPAERAKFAVEGVCVMELLEEWGRLESYSTLRLALTPRSDGTSQLEIATLSDGATVVTAAGMSRELALATARRLARHGVDEGGAAEVERPRRGAADPTRTSDLLELLGLGDARDFDPLVDITRREGRARLNVPFGVSPEGVPVNLDIKENAQQGMGPHGLLIGATGSGKSEVLRTMVLAMAATHSPEQLNFVLVDFKGGATFAGMSELPHVSATITNLENELQLVDRMEEALHGEMVRRQELLRAAGNFANVGDYEAARRAGAHNSPPMPALFVIIDEFSELLTAKPGFIDTFVAIGRLGRSLEIHLLLSTQKLEESKLRGLESHLSYRVGLRTFSQQDSRAVLGTPDAFHLPAVPGVGFLKTAGDEMTQFRASYVAAPPKPRRSTAAATAPGAKPVAARILPFSARPVLSREPVAIDEPVVDDSPVVKAGDERWDGMTVADIMVTKLLPLEPRAHQVWLDPLEVPSTLDELYGDLTISREHGLHSPSGRAAGRLAVPIGVKDLPREQRREHHVLDLAGGGGHVAIYGASQTGKSTALRTLVLALALVNTPREAQFYILDFGGGTFAGFEGGAHIAGVAGRDRPDKVARMIAEITGIMQQREAYFRANGIDSMVTYRQGRDEGRFDDGYGEVFLVIDGWQNMKADIVDLDRTIMDLTGRALAVGVHLLVSSNRQADLRQAMQGAFGTIVELRLGEHRDSAINGKAAARVPEGKPGHGIAASEHQMLVGLPRIDGSGDATTVAAGVAHAWQSIAGAWSGEPGPKLRLLPEMLPLAEVRALAPAAPVPLLGIDEARLAPVPFDLGADGHMYVFGDTQKGKTNTLRVIIDEVMRTKQPREAQFFLVDFRRSMLQEVPDVHLAGYYTTHEVATAAMKEIAGLLLQRIPGPEVTPQQLRDRSWWQGPEFYIVVDDYDLVHTSKGNPLAPIVELLPQWRDLGLHVIVARRSGGAGRALYDPLIRGLADVGAPALLLPGDPEEGAIVSRVKMQFGPAGRAQLVSRADGRRIVQIAHTEALPGDAPSAG